MVENAVASVPGVDMLAELASEVWSVIQQSTIEGTVVLGAAEQLSSQSRDLAGQVNRFLSEVRAA